jgi:hypothetical protein
MRGLLLRSKAVVVQSCLRMLHLRHRYLNQRRAALTLQCALRQHRAKTQLKVHPTTSHHASLLIKPLPPSLLSPYACVPLLCSVSLPNPTNCSPPPSSSPLPLLQSLRWARAAVLIQSRCRTFLARRSYTATQTLALTLQTWARREQARRQAQVRIDWTKGLGYHLDISR